MTTQTNAEQRSATRMSHGRLRLLGIVYVLMAALTAVALLVAQENPPSISPIFAFLFLIALGVTLTLGIWWGGLTGLISLIIWIGIKRAVGIWSRELLIPNVAEVGVTAISIIVAGVCHRSLASLWNSLAQSQLQLARLDLEDRSVGLLRESVGTLRLTEEIQRATQYRRPLGYLLILLQPSSNASQGWDEHTRHAIVQALGTQLKDLAGDQDVPYLLEENRVALIMPESNVTDVLRVVEQLSQRLSVARVLLDSMRLAPLQDWAQVRYGFAVFLGESSEIPDLLGAARQSLATSITENRGPIFQNLFIDWVTIGRKPTAEAAILASETMIS